MRIDLPWVVSIVVGVVVAGAVVLLVTLNPFARPGPAPAPSPAPDATPRVDRPAPAPPPAAVPPAQRGAAPLPPSPASPGPEAGQADADDPLASARGLLARGRLQEAQDEYLRLLALLPDDPEALGGLAAVRRRMARDDPGLLRRQAAEYEDAIARGVETKEHYTIEAMRVLARASLLAAAEIESEQGIPSPQGAALERATASPRARVTPRPAAATPSPRQRGRQTPRSASTPIVLSAGPSPVATPRPSPPAATPVPTPQPSPDEREPFFLIQIGPIFNADRAAEIAAELTLAGYAARVRQQPGGTAYLVTLGPYRQSVVDAILHTLRARYGKVPVTVSPI